MACARTTVMPDQTRRRLLSIGAAAAACMMSRPALSAAFAPARPRTVALQNLHTGESLRLAYWADGGYLAPSLQQIDRVLRDHRNNQVHAIDPRLIDLLCALDGRLGTARAYQVISGYRSPATNAMLAAESRGVAPHSLHTQGMAIDIRVEGVPLTRLRDTAKSLGIGGVGFYPRSDFVHVDVGRVRYW